MTTDASINIALKLLDEATAPMTRSMNMIERSTSAAERQMRTLTGTTRMFFGAIAAYGGGRVAKSFWDVAESFEMMEVKLDALTQGRGKETLEEINAWALDMPVNTRKAVDTFAMMQAMGLDPTIEKMQTLVDVSSIFGEEAMPRVARALGQIQTLGKLSSEELNQLAEAGINARKYLKEAFGGSVEDIQKSGMEIEKVVDAIWQGLGQDFAGAAEKAQQSGQGLWTTFVSLGEELQRQVMAAGLYDELKSQLHEVNDQFSDWITNNQDLINQKVPEYVQKIFGSVKDLVGLFDSLPDGSTKAAVLGLITGKFFGPVAGASVGAGMLLGEQRRESIRQSMRDYTTMPDSFFEDDLGKKPDYEEVDRLRDWINRKNMLIAEMQQQDKEIASRYSANTELVGPPYEKSAQGRPTIQQQPLPPKSIYDADYIREANEEWMEFNRLQSESGQLYKQVMTPVEEYAETIERLGFLYRETDMSLTTYNRNMDEASDKLSQAMWEIKNAGSDKEWADFNALQAETESLFRSIRTPAEEYAATLERLRYLYENTDMSLETFQQSIGVAADEYRKAVEKMNEDTSALSEFQKQAFRNMESFAGEFFYDVMQGRNEDLLGSFLDMTQRMVSEWLAAQATMALFGENFSKTNELGGILGSAVSAFATPAFNSPGSAATGNYGPMPPGRASGGPVYPGETYLVGEKGPELLKMGSAAGTIIPNNKLGGGVAVHNQIHVNMGDNSGSDLQSAHRTGVEIGRMLEIKMRQFLTDEQRPGGLLNPRGVN